MNREFAYPGYFAMIPAGPDPNTARTERFFAVAAGAIASANDGGARNSGRLVRRQSADWRAGQCRAVRIHNSPRQTYPETETFTPILNAVAATSCDLLFFCSQWVMTQTATFTPSA